MSFFTFITTSKYPLALSIGVYCLVTVCSLFRHLRKNNEIIITLLIIESKIIRQDECTQKYLKAFWGIFLHTAPLKLPQNKMVTDMYWQKSVVANVESVYITVTCLCRYLLDLKTIIAVRCNDTLCYLQKETA